MRHLGSVLLGGLALLCLLAPPPSQAAWTTGSPPEQRQLDAVRFGTPVLAPFAYTHFCRRYASDCRAHGTIARRAPAVSLTVSRRAELDAVNKIVNRSIAPKRYVNDTTFDTWRVAPKRGDCNDYAVTKRHALLKKGWPTRALLLSEVVTKWGEHHLVLLVQTDHGAFVLDNLSTKIRPWRRAPYRWVRVQSPTDPVLWSTVQGNRAKT